MDPAGLILKKTAPADNAAVRKENVFSAEPIAHMFKSSNLTRWLMIILFSLLLPTISPPGITVSDMATTCDLLLFSS